MSSNNSYHLTNTDIERYMRRALQLAALGAGHVSPNPMVGCVIVHQNRIIGEGWHQRYGDWHAEVNAVNDVADKSLLPESDVFVTLEPCSHFGKTPPCADLLVKHRVKRVFVCNDDPNPLVAGKGIAKLEAAGIAVQTGILAEEGRALNKRFFTFFEKKRPYITLKWAESADGFIAKNNYEAVQISNALSRRWVHKLRSEEDAIMVGYRTALYDNPQLNTRFWTGKNPVRILIDKDLSLPATHLLLADGQATLCYNDELNEQRNNVTFIKIPHASTQLTAVLADLYQRKIQSLIVEGGSALLQQFIDQGLWDEAQVWKSLVKIQSGIAAPLFNQTPVSQHSVGDNQLRRYQFVS